MPVDLTLLQTQTTLANLTRAVTAMQTTTLAHKIQQLKQQRSPDPIQQLQTEAIVELFDVVRQIQQALSPTPYIPGADAAAAARAAAEAAALQQKATAHATFVPAPPMSVSKAKAAMIRRR